MDTIKFIGIGPFFAALALILAIVSIVVFAPSDNESVEKFKNNVAENIIKIEYEGHTYLSYRNSYFNRSGFCHDENCKCKNKQGFGK